MPASKRIKNSQAMKNSGRKSKKREKKIAQKEQENHEIQENMDQQEDLEAPEDLKESNDNNSEKPPRFKFVCQKCGLCCKSENIIISIHDLERWANDNTIYRVIHMLKMVEDNGEYKIMLMKDDDGYCNLYHRDNKQCTIYDTRPLVCRSFPLMYDGDKYILKTMDCKGLNKEGMTKDQLISIREAAFDEFIAFRQMSQVLPILYGLIFNKLVEDSQNILKKMSGKEGIKDNDEENTNSGLDGEEEGK